MKKILLISAVLILLHSCSMRNVIYYEYNGVTITRISEEAESIFYYGKCNDENIPCPKSFIKATYSGFNNLMDGYLVFHSNKRVELIGFDGFPIIDSIKGLKDSLYLNEFPNPLDVFTFRDKIGGNYDSIVYISDVLEIEKDDNKRNHSKVKAIYPD